MQLCCIIVFPSRKPNLNELLSKLVEQTKQLYVLPTLIECHYAIVSFDLWMPKAGHDIFALVIKFLRDDWQPKQITLGLFEQINITGKFLAKMLIKLLDNYDLKEKKYLCQG